jgi:autonomous glycyl radical cofactor GrcA
LREEKALGAAAAAFRLIHFAHKCDADKIDSFWIGVLFVSIGERQKIASKDEVRNDQILNVYIIGNCLSQKIPIEITRN